MSSPRHTTQISTHTRTAKSVHIPKRSRISGIPNIYTSICNMHLAVIALGALALNFTVDSSPGAICAGCCDIWVDNMPCRVLVRTIPRDKLRRKSSYLCARKNKRKSRRPSLKVKEAFTKADRLGNTGEKYNCCMPSISKIRQLTRIATRGWKVTSPPAKLVTLSWVPPQDRNACTSIVGMRRS